jgi:hypothetical protein
VYLYTKLLSLTLKGASVVFTFEICRVTIFVLLMTEMGVASNGTFMEYHEERYIINEVLNHGMDIINTLVHA